MLPRTWLVTRLWSATWLGLVLASCHSAQPTGPVDATTHETVARNEEDRTRLAPDRIRDVVGWTDLAAAEQLFGGAAAINARGEIVGEIDVNGAKRAFVYRHGVLELLPNVPGYDGEPHAASAINSRGQIVGSVRPERQFGSVAVLWSHGTVTILPPYGATTEAAAYDINEEGTIVGASWVINIHREVTARPLMWKNGQPVALPIYGPTGTHNRAQAINDHGEIVGTLHETDDVVRAARWDREGRIALLAGSVGPPTQASSSAVDINNRGWIVGLSRRVGALWKDGELIELSQFRDVQAINELGQVVGTVQRGHEFHAALWDCGELIPLGDFRFCSPNVSRALDVNDAGTVLGAWTRPHVPGGTCRGLPVLWQTRGGFRR